MVFFAEIHMSFITDFCMIDTGLLLYNEFILNVICCKLASAQRGNRLQVATGQRFLYALRRHCFEAKIIGGLFKS